MNLSARRALVPLTLLLPFLGACDTPPTGDNPPAPALPAPSKAAPSAAPAASSPPAAVKSATSKINGKILNDVEMGDISAALKKAGWTDKGGSGMAIGGTKTVTVNAEKDGVKAKVTLIKPTVTNEEGGGVKIASARDQASGYEAKGAVHIDADILLAVEIEGKKDEAKKLLDSLLDR